MRKCKNCQVAILDNTLVCPLCSSVLEGEAEDGYEPMYPDVKNKVRALNLIVKIYTFVAIIVEAVLIIVNVRTFRNLWWSAISGIAILYLYVTLRFSIQKNRGYRRTIMIQLIGATLLSVAIDFIVGYRGWSVNFVLPGAILLLDLAIFILMIVNKSYWQSYILMQMFTTILGIMVLVFWHQGLIWNPVVSIVAASVSAALLLGTLIFGDRKAINELKRRFHM
ncbi:MAG: zinc ribbon domain-containing protein [Lachnospiraceae bacterium]|nr:zinc ribbon domain-containing protein [Lachnospiraceae bacterium]MCI9148886.1 zinc ribbon domain-containing protein [Lachnospiraceae bacterium]